MSVVDAEGREIGTVTSGTFSPTLKTGIALALLMEGLLALALLTLAPAITRHEEAEMAVFSFDAEPMPDPQPDAPQPKAKAA